MANLGDPAPVPVDLQSAGGIAPPSDESSLIKALLQQAMTPSQAPSIAQHLASGMAGFGAGLQGQPNPVAAQMMQQQQLQQQAARDKLAIAGVLQGVQRERREAQQGQLDTIKTLLSSDNDEAYSAGVKALMGHAGKQGIQIPQAFGQALVQRKIKPEQWREMDEMIASMGPTPETMGLITRRMPGLDPAIVQDYMGNFIRNPRALDAIRRMYKVPTTDELAKAALESKAKQVQLLHERYGLDPKDPVSQGILRDAIVKHGKPFDELAPQKQQEMLVAHGITLPTKQTDIAAMGREFNDQSRSFITVRNAYQNMENAMREPVPTKEADLAIVYAVMKIQSPESSVMQGEFGLAKDFPGVPAWVIQMYNKIRDGQLLAPEVRENFINMAKRQYVGGTLANQERLEQQYAGRATRAKMLPEDVVTDHIGPHRSLIPKAPTAQMGPLTDPRLSTAERRLMLKYGKGASSAPAK